MKPRLRSRPLIVALAAALALPAAPVWPQADVRLPALGDSSSEEMTPGAERRLGEQVMREVRRDPAYLDDPILIEYVQALWVPLLRAAVARGDIGADTRELFAWDTFLVRDRAVNAFALPGGHVGVYLGLVAMTATRDELASVLAHELSHVTQRHIARSVASASRQSTVGMLAMVLGILAASRSNNPDALQATIAGGQAVMAQGQLNFSRDMEREADRIGYRLYADAGYAPAGVAAMFEKLDAANRLNDSGQFPYLRSHPLTTERVAEARARLLTPSGNPSSAGATGAAPASPSGAAASAAHALTHTLMQARARVLMDPLVQAQRRHLEPPAPGAPVLERAGAAAAAALAAARLGEHPAAQAAEAALDRALAEWRAAGGTVEPLAERALVLLRAEMRLARGDAPAAWQALAAVGGEAAWAPAPPLRTPPRGDRMASRALLLARAEAALRLAETPSAALERAEMTELNGQLQAHVAEERLDANAWALMARTSEVLGLRLRSLRAQAEARAAMGDLSAAIDRLRSAQSVSRQATGADIIEASVIDARLRELLSQRRQLAAELRGGRRDPTRDPDREDDRPAR